MSWLRIRLHQPRPEGAEARLALGRDLEIVRMFGGNTSHPLPPLTMAEVGRWLKDLRRHLHAWIVEHEGRLIEEARLDRLETSMTRGRVSRWASTIPQSSESAGPETVRLVLTHAFEVLKLHRVDLRVLAYNDRAQSCGLVIKGRGREAALAAGARHDDVIMGILAPEFRAKR